MTKMPKAVFWDMDGSLVDSEPLHTEALEAGMRSFGLTPPPDLHDRVLGKIDEGIDRLANSASRR